MALRGLSRKAIKQRKDRTIKSREKEQYPKGVYVAGWAEGSVGTDFNLFYPKADRLTEFSYPLY